MINEKPIPKINNENKTTENFFPVNKLRNSYLLVISIHTL